MVESERSKLLNTESAMSMLRAKLFATKTDAYRDLGASRRRQAGLGCTLTKYALYSSRMGK